MGNRGRATACALAADRKPRRIASPTCRTGTASSPRRCNHPRYYQVHTGRGCGSAVYSLVAPPTTRPAFAISVKPGPGAPGQLQPSVPCHPVSAARARSGCFAGSKHQAFVRKRARSVRRIIVPGARSNARTHIAAEGVDPDTPAEGAGGEAMNSASGTVLSRCPIFHGGPTSLIEPRIRNLFHGSGFHGSGGTASTDPETFPSPADQAGTNLAVDSSGQRLPRGVWKFSGPA